MLVLDVGGLGQSLCLMVWPDPLLLYQTCPPHPAMAFIVMQLTLLVTAALQFKAKRFGLLAGLVFFYIALLPSSRMTAIGGTPAGYGGTLPLLSNRGTGHSLASVCYLGKRHGPWSAITVALVALALLTPLTWNRNGDWANEVRLFESEYRRGGQGSQVLRLLTAAYLREGKHGQAAKICDTNPFEGESLRKYATTAPSPITNWAATRMPNAHSCKRHKEGQTNPKHMRTWRNSICAWGAGKMQ